MGRVGAGVLAVMTLFGLASFSYAQDGGIEPLDRASDWLDDHRILGSFRFSPHVAQRLVFDDNLFLNDTNEPDTEGRESETISDSLVRLGLVMPVNKATLKLFKRDRLTLLSYEVRFLEHLGRGDTDSINQTLNTELFSLLEDLLDVGFGNKITVEAGARYSDVTDPIDVLVRDLTLAGFPTRGQIQEIRRHRVQANVGAGYLGNDFDAFVGYRFDRYRFKESFFDQADHTEHTSIAEIGVNPPLMPEKRLFARFEYTNLHFPEGFLNDATKRGYFAGLEGRIFSKKLEFLLEGGFLDWDAKTSGLLGDEEDYGDGVGLARLAFQPWLDRKTRFQVQGQRGVEWSAISNFRIDQRVEFTFLEELIAKRLDADLTVAYSHLDPSDGPKRRMIEAGVGLSYHLCRQMDATLRYLHRRQSGGRETSLTTADPVTGNPLRIETNGDFRQNIVSLGIEVTF